MARCPGQDQRYWTADDIFDVCCPFCDNEIEFWKDEPFRLCRGCMKEVRNPRIDLGCAKWCKFSDQCLGRSADQQLAAAPVVDKLKALLESLTEDSPERYHAALEVYRVADMLLPSEGGDPCKVKAGALLISFVRDETHPVEMARRVMKETALSEEETVEICEILIKLLSSDSSLSVEGGIINDSLLLAEMDPGETAAEKHLITEGGRMIYSMRVKRRTDRI